MDEQRFARLETRVDEIRDDVSEVKSDLKLRTELIKNDIHGLKDEFARHTEAVISHVAGDEKIVTEIQPLLKVIPLLKEVAEDHNYRKLKKQERTDKLKYWGLRIGVATGAISLLSALISFFS